MVHEIVLIVHRSKRGGYYRRTIGLYVGLLRVSKLVAAEATPLLYRNNDFEFYAGALASLQDSRGGSRSQSQDGRPSEQTEMALWYVVFSVTCRWITTNYYA